MQVPRRCHGQCQQWCRYPADVLSSVSSDAGALASVSSGAKPGLLHYWGSFGLRIRKRNSTGCIGLLLLLAGQAWHSRTWLYPGPAPLFQTTRWFRVKHRLQDWADGPGRLEVSRSKPFVYTSPTRIWLRSEKREWWIFNSLGGISTLYIHWLGPPLFLLWCSESNLEWKAC